MQAIQTFFESRGARDWLKISKNPGLVWRAVRNANCRRGLAKVCQTIALQESLAVANFSTHTRNPSRSEMHPVAIPKRLEYADTNSGCSSEPPLTSRPFESAAASMMQIHKGEQKAGVGLGSWMALQSPSKIPTKTRWGIDFAIIERYHCAVR